jgi:hypothetical protein
MELQARWESQLLTLAGKVSHPSTRPFYSYWGRTVGNVVEEAGVGEQEEHLEHWRGAGS